MELNSDALLNGVVLSVFLLLLFAASVCDVLTRRIPNALTASMAILGVFVCWFGRGPASLQAGLLAAGGSFVLGMTLLALRVMGGGDVKLFAAASLWLGPALSITAALATAIAGGVVAVYFLRTAEVRNAVAARSKFSQFQLDDEPDDDRVPYGIAISVGCVWAWWSQFQPRMGII